MWEKTRTGMAVIVLLVCALLVGTPANGGKGGNGKGGGGGGGWVGMCDTFRDGATDNVMSDGAGSYCESGRKLSVGSGSTNGGHHLDSEGSGREVYLDFADCANADPTSCLRGGFELKEVFLSIENGADPGGVNILEMSVGESSEVGLVIGFKNGRRNHARVSFGRVTTVVACADAGDKVTVTRLADDAWEFESLTGERACFSEVLNNDWSNPVAHGYYHMPFKLTAVVE